MFQTSRLVGECRPDRFRQGIYHRLQDVSGTKYMSMLISSRIKSCRTQSLTKEGKGSLSLRQAEKDQTSSKTKHARQGHRSRSHRLRRRVQCPHGEFMTRSQAMSCCSLAEEAEQCREGPATLCGVEASRRKGHLDFPEIIDSTLRAGGRERRRVRPLPNPGKIHPCRTPRPSAVRVVLKSGGSRVGAKSCKKYV